MTQRAITNIIDDKLDWFFQRVLKGYYDKRREVLNAANKSTIPAIDYILRTHISDTSSYPPESVAQWNGYLTHLDSEKKQVMKQILLLYLKLDIGNYLCQKESSTRTRTKDKLELASLDMALNSLSSISVTFDFKNSVIHLATGLWAVDNEQTNLIISSLSNPSLVVADYFKPSKDIIRIIIDSLIISHQPRMALFMTKVQRYDLWDDEYDAIYAFLLISTGQLIEALKYERLFSDRENYHEILERFFELCSERNVTKSLNCLNLSIEEEEILNQHLVYESSRPVTPSGTQTRSNATPSASKQKPRNRNIQVVQRTPSFNDSPARNTRSARKRKTVK